MYNLFYGVPFASLSFDELIDLDYSIYSSTISISSTLTDFC